MAGTTTAAEVFFAAIALMGELSPTGAADSSDNADYRQRALPLLNILVGENYPLSDTYATGFGGTRPVAPAITDMGAVIALDNVLARTVLPFGLAALLLLEENPVLANFFQQRYEELRARLASRPSEFEAIASMYGGTEHGTFSRW